uniref:Uncharacterized protein n=1 Tax=Rhizophora mucronata TaxID=61149 RepID=A0A2P2PM64_RHIMU
MVGGESSYCIPEMWH